MKSEHTLQYYMYKIEVKVLKSTGMIALYPWYFGQISRRISGPWTPGGAHVLTQTEEWSLNSLRQSVMSLWKEGADMSHLQTACMGLLQPRLSQCCCISLLLAWPFKGFNFRHLSASSQQKWVSFRNKGLQWAETEKRNWMMEVFKEMMPWIICN